MYSAGLSFEGDYLGHCPLMALTLFGHVRRMAQDIPANTILQVGCNIQDKIPPRGGGSSEENPLLHWFLKSVPVFDSLAVKPLWLHWNGPNGKQSLQPTVWLNVEDNDLKGIKDKVAMLEIMLKSLFKPKKARKARIKAGIPLLTWNFLVTAAHVVWRIIHSLASPAVSKHFWVG